MNVGRVLRTVRWLRGKQLVWQVLNRLRKPAFVAVEASTRPVGRMRVEAVVKPECLRGKRFRFLNIEADFEGWNMTQSGMLWAYNLNYMDWLNQPGMTAEEGALWIDRFIADIPQNRVGLDPYPTALRLINWAKFISRFPGEATKPRLDSMYSQARHLERRLERHLLGNHLLEDAYALFVAANFFGDNRMLKRVRRLLHAQLREQVLPDGAHYEQSPMYHCILLDRLLDCINFDPTGDPVLMKTAVRMLGHLESVRWADGSLPMLNDSAEGIAPAPDEIFAYAHMLGLQWPPIAMRECGYRKLKNDIAEAIIDVGGIAATYQPGHSHADALSYELRLGGRPIVVDTGISTYEKNSRRQYERSTAAHNTVTPACGGDSSEVWGGFRVGRRAVVKIEAEGTEAVTASHNGFARPHRRTFTLTATGLNVTDEFDGDGVSRIHLAPGITILSKSTDEIITSGAIISVAGATEITIAESEVSTEYNMFSRSALIEIHFSGRMEYHISQ